MSELIRASHPNGDHSKRGYTRTELAAARRQGLIHTKGDDGPMFWATGDWYPEHVRKTLRDYAIIQSAIEREWHKEGDPK